MVRRRRRRSLASDFTMLLDGFTSGASGAIFGSPNPNYYCIMRHHATAAGWGEGIGTAVLLALPIIGFVAALPRIAMGAKALATAVMSFAVDALRSLAGSVLRKETFRTAEGAAGAAERGAVRGVERGASRSADDALSCSVNSFTADTAVLMADGSKKRIEDVKVGDKVLATDPETGVTEARPVTELIRHSGEHTMVEVTLDDGSVIQATDRHPFWDATTRAFVYAIDLKVGDQVLSADGRLLTIRATRVYKEDLTAYNLAIDGIHTYYAGDTPVLVHNTCGPVNLASEERTTHILDGNATGGGHLFPGKPGKTPFPAHWSRDEVMNAVSEVITSPSSLIGQTAGDRTVVYGVVDRVLIKVVTDWGDIITAHPLF